MAVELIVVTQLPLPCHAGEWNLSIRDERGGMVVSEQVDPDVVRALLGATGPLAFEPASVITIRKAWELSEVVGEALVEALGGVLLDDMTMEISFRSLPRKYIYESVEERLWAAFRAPEGYFRRWDEQERQRFARDAASNPMTRKENDWGDV